MLGYLSPNNFLGGKMRLDIEAARRAIEAVVAGPLGMTVMDAAEGIVRIINVKMQEAIKAISTMRGHDLRDFKLLAFGGAGPLHAGSMAADLGMAGVVIPLYPGVYSAMGLVMSDVKHDYIRSRLVNLTRITEDEINTVFAELAAQARTDLTGEEFPADRISVEYAIDMRYAGQGYEMTLPCPHPLKPGDLATLRRVFDEEHRKSFGHTAPSEPVEIVSWRLRGVGRVPPVTLPKYEVAGLRLDAAVREVRKARFQGKMLECPVYQRERLDVGVSFAGPAIVDQLDCTSVLAPGQIATVDAYKNIIVETGAV